MFNLFPTSKIIREQRCYLQPDLPETSCFSGLRLSIIAAPTHQLKPERITTFRVMVLVCQLLSADYNAVTLCVFVFGSVDFLTWSIACLEGYMIGVHF